jgi:hypothetical protein
VRFDKWIDVFLEEKGIAGTMLEVEHSEMTHFVEYEVLIEFIKSLPKEQKNKIKETFVMIDFKNGDCLHFLNHLAKGMVSITF